ncbi:hypothetical protein EK904_006985 [Melospiza melodia maxima]|nr:hypothetical protein EK904_006985 [Melospiza melodia maxima]
MELALLVQEPTVKEYWHFKRNEVSTGRGNRNSRTDRTGTACSWLIPQEQPAPGYKFAFGAPQGPMPAEKAGDEAAPPQACIRPGIRAHTSYSSHNTPRPDDKETNIKQSWAPTNEDAAGAFSFSVRILYYYREAAPSLQDKTKRDEGMLFLKYYTHRECRAGTRPTGSGHTEIKRTRNKYIKKKNNPTLN